MSHSAFLRTCNLIIFLIKLKLNEFHRIKWTCIEEDDNWRKLVFRILMMPKIRLVQLNQRKQDTKEQCLDFLILAFLLEYIVIPNMICIHKCIRLVANMRKIEKIANRNVSSTIARGIHRVIKYCITVYHVYFILFRLDCQ